MKTVLIFSQTWQLIIEIVYNIFNLWEMQITHKEEEILVCENSACRIIDIGG